MTSAPPQGWSAAAHIRWLKAIIGLLVAACVVLGVATLAPQSWPLREPLAYGGRAGFGIVFACFMLWIVHRKPADPYSGPYARMDPSAAPAAVRWCWRLVAVSVAAMNLLPADTVPELAPTPVVVAALGATVVIVGWAVLAYRRTSTL